jgi:hypothetical protein
MPTVLRQAGYELLIYNPPREHGPAHVHVFHAGQQVVIDLDPIKVTRVGRMAVRNIVAAVRLVEAHQEFLLTEWERIHG